MTIVFRGFNVLVEPGDQWQPTLAAHDFNPPLPIGDDAAGVVRYLTHAGLPVFDAAMYLTSDGRPVFRAALTTTVGVTEDGEHVFGFTAAAGVAYQSVNVKQSVNRSYVY